jgi:hypothetical protein
MFNIRNQADGSEVGELQSLPLLVDGLFEDIEHPDVSVEHESGWALSLFASGLVVLENVDDDSVEPTHCQLSRDHMLIAAVAVAVGSHESIRYFGWLPGYGRRSL